MNYYSDHNILIRELRGEDIETLCREERRQGWDSVPEKFQKRLKHKLQRQAVPLIAEFKGKVAGYVSVYYRGQGGPFLNKEVPEIIDFAVLEKYRNKGVGSKLMDTAEEIAAQRSDIVYLGVGLHKGYGNAQRLYIKRGYLPDGSGVWYKDAVLKPYADCKNDDSLVLYLYKKLNELKRER